MRKLAIQITVVLFVSMVTGLVASFFVPGTTSTVNAADVLAGKTGRTVTLEEAYALNQAGDTGFIDARPAQFYQHEHIRHAINVPYTVSTTGEEVQSLDKNKVWVVYCKGPRCNQAHILAQKLDRAGFTKIYIFPGGMEEWRLAQYPLERPAE